MSLTFERLADMNAQRCEEAFPQCRDWDASDWAVALAGEVGELCNLIKKMRRGDDLGSPWDAVAEELADIVTYVDLLASHLHFNLEDVVRDKWDKVSERVGSPLRLIEGHRSVRRAG
ncbi:MAG: hypothetical protein MI757_14705 [Pirellulales bacterium]|nr:hypothetical protein [Pirellulales bacterium]